MTKIESTKTQTKALTTAESTEFMTKVFAEVVDPNRSEIVDIAADGDIAVVVYPKISPKADWQALVRALRDGSTGTIVRLTPERASELFAKADPVTLGWMTRREGLRILLLIHEAMFLINNDGEGWYLEPGSTTAEYLRTLN